MIKLPQCKDCKYRLDIDVYFDHPNREEIKRFLKENNIKHICLAFYVDDNDYVGELGSFDGIGCEVFERREDERD